MVIFNEKPPDLKDFVARCQSFSLRPALISEGKTYTYESLLRDSAALAQFLLGDRPDMEEARIAFFIPASYAYVFTQWGIWRAGGIAVPLCTSHPLPSLEYVLQDTDTRLLITTRAHRAFLDPLGASGKVAIVCLEDIPLEDTPERKLPELESSRRAMILYTSGTTSLPKGVVSTHQNIQAQIL